MAMETTDTSSQAPLPMEQNPAPIPGADASAQAAPAVNPEVSRDPQADDFSQEFAEHRDNMKGAAAFERMSRVFSMPSPSEPGSSGPAEPGQSKLAQSARSIKTPPKADSKSIPLDMLRGAMESPTQAVGGARDAVQEMIDLAGEVGRFTPPELPDVADPKSTTGGLVRGISQFMTGFYTGGKLLKGVKTTSRLATGLKIGAQGAIADFAAFDGHDKRLADLVAEQPALKDLVPKFMQSDPNDTEIEGRLKGVLEGAVGGALADGFLKSLKYMRLGKKIQGIAKTTGEFMGDEGGVDLLQKVSKEDFATLGDPDVSDVFLTRKLDEATAAKTGVAKEVDINWASVNTTDDVKKLMQKMANDSGADIDVAKRGKRTWETTKASAAKEDAWKTLVERRQGQALNAEQLVSSKQLWIASGEKVEQLANLAAQSPTDANLFALRKMMVVHDVIQKEVLASGSEAGRALNALKIPVGSGPEIANQITAILEATGGNKAAHDIARHIQKMSQAGMHADISKFVEKTAFAKSRDAIAQVWMNMLVSNPKTWVANALSAMATGTQAIYERKGAEFISQRLGSENGVALGESMAMAHGALEAFRDSLRAFSKQVKTDGVAKTAKNYLTQDAPDVFGTGSTKYEMTGGHVASDNWGVASDTSLGRALDMTDIATRTPNRILSKTDNFFKSIGYRMELHAQAVRQATSEMKGVSHTDDAFRARVAELVENPPENVRIEAINAATYMTFTNKPAETLKRIGDAIQGVPVMGRLLLPFKNTPINIMTYTFERTPLAPLVKSWRADVAAGGARADIAMSRMATGTMIMQLALDAAMKGEITGRGPQDPGQRANWLQSHRPYSMKVGDTWVSFNRVDPLGFTLGISADIAEAVANAQDEIGQESFEEAMIAASFAIANNVQSKTYMQGTAEFFGAVANPQMKGEGYVKKLAGSLLIPSGVAATAQLSDPYMRTADDVVSALRNRVPGLKEGLPLYRDLWGRTVDYRSGLGVVFDAISPVYVKKTNPEAIDQEISRLEYYPTMPERKVSLQDPMNPSPGGVMMELNAHQYSRYVELAGNELKHPAWGVGAKDFLNQVIEGKHALSSVYKLYSDGPDGGKAQFIRHWINQYRDLAKRQILEEDGALRGDYAVKKKSKAGRFRPDIIGMGQ